MVAVHVPWDEEVCDSIPDSFSESETQLLITGYMIKAMGLLDPCRYRSDKIDICVQRSAKLLEQAGTLTRFRLILPDSFKLSKETLSWFNGEFPLFFDRDNFKSLEIELVTLHGGFNTRYFAPRYRAKVLTKNVRLREAAVDRGVKVVDMAYNYMGYYPVPLDDGRNILESDGLKEGFDLP